MRLSVVIPTKNEEANIAACIRALDGAGEIIVVDNESTDRTREIAASLGAKVSVKGPERCAQRNHGWREASGEWVMFVDADMVVTRELMEELVSRPDDSTVDAYYIPEVRGGSGLRVKARNFERSFYDGTVIDGLRVIRRRWLEKTGGYDENLVACEDWDLDRRLISEGVKTAVTRAHLVHNESRQNLAVFLRKKAYYSKSVDRYRAKWGEDAVTRRQFGFGYRFFGVFFGNGGWKRILRHPVLAAVMYFERFAVGFTYLINRKGA